MNIIYKDADAKFPLIEIFAVRKSIFYNFFQCGFRNYYCTILISIAGNICLEIVLTIRYKAFIRGIFYRNFEF